VILTDEGGVEGVSDLTGLMTEMMMRRSILFMPAERPQER